MRRYISRIALLLISYTLWGQGLVIELHQQAALKQVLGITVKSTSLLPMNELDLEFGYILYTTEIDLESKQSVLLEIENVRDYAAVYIDGIFAGTISFEHKSLTLDMESGEHQLSLYTENIGRITYGPEILDNSKGLFGKARLNGKDLFDWDITPLQIKDCDVKKLDFSDKDSSLPSFHRGYFTIDKIENKHLDITGWGMGEVWLNGQYLGNYWEEEAQQSIPVSESIFKKGENELVVFELKNNNVQHVNLTQKPVFK